MKRLIVLATVAALALLIVGKPEASAYVQWLPGTLLMLREEEQQED